MFLNKSLHMDPYTSRLIGSVTYIKPISEKYIKSKLKVYFPIFLFKISILIAHLNKLIFRKGTEIVVLFQTCIQYFTMGII